MVEELLESFVGVVDAKLFKSVELENFETSDIEDTDEVVSGEVGGEGAVDDLDEPGRKPVKWGGGKASSSSSVPLVPSSSKDSKAAGSTSESSGKASTAASKTSLKPRSKKPEISPSPATTEFYPLTDLDTEMVEAAEPTLEVDGLEFTWPDLSEPEDL